MCEILCCDDEKVIVELVITFLSEMKYKIKGFSDPFEFLQYFKEHGQNTDLVIIDYFMPTYDGDKLFKILKEQKNNLKGILMTGHTMDEIPNGEIFDLVVYKPFSLVKLSEEVKKLST